MIKFNKSSKIALKYFLMIMLIGGFLFVLMSSGFVIGENYVGHTESGIVNISILEDDASQVLNLTFNNTGVLEVAAPDNVTEFNVTIPDSFKYIASTQASNVSSAFTNTSVVLRWYNFTHGILNASSTSAKSAIGEFGFNVSAITPGSYMLNMTILNGTAGNLTYSNATVNITVNDTTAPVVEYDATTTANLSHVTSSSVYVGVSVVEVFPSFITFNLSYVNGTNVNLTTYSMSSQTDNTNITFIGLGIGTYIVNVSVNDTSGNTTTIYRTFSLGSATTTSDDTSSGGSAGVTPSYWKLTRSVTNEDFEQGFTRDFGVKERIKFMINGANHYMGVLSLTSSIVIINVSSTPQQATLNIGDLRKFDVTDDDYYDLSVKFNSISNNKATLTTKAIKELVTEESEVEEQDKETVAIDESKEDMDEDDEGIVGLVVIIILGLVVVGVIIYYILKKKK